MAKSKPSIKAKGGTKRTQPAERRTRAVKSTVRFPAELEARMARAKDESQRTGRAAQVYPELGPPILDEDD